jgi:ribosomal protein S18 acetylase RimI-like enzyme
MLTYAPPTVEQYDEFLQMMWEEMQEYLPEAMRILHMTWAEYSQIFRTLGEVRSIYQDEHLAGFYWIEQRVDILHIHGIILKNKFRGQGIGTAVLTMLIEHFTGKMDKIELGVYQSNSGAIRLYEKMGFQTVRFLDDLGFYIMQKPLI